MKRIKRTDGFIYQRDNIALTGAAAESFLTAAAEEALYFNLHSAAFPAGELRGQLSLEEEEDDGEQEFTASLTGDQEVPPVETEASGEGSVEAAPAPDGLSLSVEAAVFGLTLEAASLFHIHNAPAGTNGGVLVNLDPDGALRTDDADDLDAAGFTPASLIEGTSRRDEIVGSRAIEFVEAGNGNDQVNGRGGNDDLDGGNGRDNLIGGAGNDDLDGGNGRDTLTGGRGNDDLDGGRGRDVLAGGAGTDEIETGSGRDDVVFAAADLGSGVDEIEDFNARQDRFVFQFEASAPRKRFDRFDGEDPEASLRANASAIVVEGDALTADEAADAIAASVRRSGEGLFAVYDAEAELALLIHSANLSDAMAERSIVAEFGDTPGILDRLSTSSFVFEDCTCVGFGSSDPADPA